ncbi:hypothetical protein Ancab_026068 [Ancistrocladus abbreviatus]
MSTAQASVASCCRMSIEQKRTKKQKQANGCRHKKETTHSRSKKTNIPCDPATAKKKTQASTQTEAGNQRKEGDLGIKLSYDSTDAGTNQPSNRGPSDHEPSTTKMQQNEPCEKHSPAKELCS